MIGSVGLYLGRTNGYSLVIFVVPIGLGRLVVIVLFISRKRSRFRLGTVVIARFDSHLANGRAWTAIFIITSRSYKLTLLFTQLSTRFYNRFRVGILVIAFVLCYLAK